MTSDSGVAAVTEENYRVNELARFRILVGGIGASVCMSTFYGFNILSNHMMVTYGFSASDLTTITTTGIVVGFVTFPGGMLLDYAGPMWVCMLALVLNALGALLFGLAFSGTITASVVKFAVFCAIMNLGCANFDTGSLMAVLGSFPLTKGSVVAIMKTLAGLGASVLAVINYSFFRTSYAEYMYFMTAVVVVCGSCAAFFIRFPPYHLVDRERKCLLENEQKRRRLTERAYLTQYPPMRRFFLGFCIIVTLVVYLTTQSLCVAYAPGITDRDRFGITIGVIILVLCLTLVAAPFPFLGGMSVPPSPHYPELPTSAVEPAHEGNATTIGEYRGEDIVLQQTAAEIRADEAALVDLAAGEHFSADDHVDGFDPATKKPVAGEVAISDTEDRWESVGDLDAQYQGTFWQNLRTVDLWLCLWNTFCTWGCGMVIAFNSAQIYRALADDAYDTKTNTMYAAIIGVGSALGRLTMGIFETVLVRYPSENRPVITTVYPVSATCMVIGLIFLVSLPLKSKAIVIGFFFDSLGNGFSWACTALTIRTLYAKDIGKHYNFMYVGAFLAVIALNRFGYGELYNAEAKRQRDKGGKIYPRCAGKACVQTSLLILLAVNATAIIGSTICHIRFRRYVLRHRAARKAAREATQNGAVASAARDE